MDKILIDKLFSEYDTDTGQHIFFLDEELAIPFTGIVVDYFKGKLSWEFETKDGYRHGKEKKYYDDTGELMEENDMEQNTICGIQKEFYRSGKIKSKSIVLRNLHIETILYDEDGNIIERDSIDKDNPPIGYYLDWDMIDEYQARYSLE
jgi:hypothetical protein